MMIDQEEIKFLITVGIILSFTGVALLINRSFRPKIIGKALVLDKEKPRHIIVTNEPFGDPYDFGICYNVKLKIGDTTECFGLFEKDYRKIKVGDMVKIEYKVGRIFKDIFYLSVLDIKQ